MKPYYSDSAVQIFLGDCREILPTLGRFDLMLTDPPYGIGFAAQPADYQRAAGMKPQAWDDVRIDIRPLLPAATHQIIWGGNYFSLPVSRGWLAWCKPDAPPSMGDIEFAWTSRDRNSEYFLWSISATNPERLGHPTQKPLALMSWCLAPFVDVETIVDPFAGVGTVGRAAKDRGLRCTMIEIEERYAEIAALRMGQEVLALI